MKTNVKSTEASPTLRTHGGALAAKEGPEKELLRTVSCCLLWENSFYESGSSIANRIAELSQKVSIKFLSDLAIRARHDLKLRHVPLFLALEMLKAKEKTGYGCEQANLAGETISRVINRADELSEILSIWWKDGKKKLPRQLKAGIAKAFRKFDEYQLSKWDRESKVKLRDALFLSHPKPVDADQAALWKKLVENKLEAPMTWEVLLSGGMSKKDAFTKLLTEKKLGYMALLQNLRNMEEGEVDQKLIETALLEGAPKSWALPFRFIAAAKAVPKMEGLVEKAMILSAQALPKLSGQTLLVIDVSGSMVGQVSGKSQMSRIDAACGLAILMREQAEDLTVYVTGGDDGRKVHKTTVVPARQGFALRDVVHQVGAEQGGGGIFLKQCMDFIKTKEKSFDRVIVITDEQDCDDERVKASGAPKLGKRNYILNVGVYEPALPVTGAGWTRISGFSEAVVTWIMADEAEEQGTASSLQQQQKQ